MSDKKKLITFKVTDSMINDLHKMLNQLNYNNRSELIRDAIAEFIEKEYYKGDIPKNSVINDMHLI